MRKVLVALILAFFISCGGGESGNDVTGQDTIQPETKQDIKDAIPEQKGDLKGDVSGKEAEVTPTPDVDAGGDGDIKDVKGEEEVATCETECCSDSDCDDNNLCTEDKCNENGECEHTDISCDDNDPCTEDSCDPEKGCVNTQIPDCCVETTIYETGFETDEETEGIEIKENTGNEEDPIIWNVTDKKAKTGSKSIYFGNPETGNYDNGKRVSSSFILPEIELPSGVKSELQFSMYANIEADQGWDEFNVYAHVDGKKVALLKKDENIINKDDFIDVTVSLSAFAGKKVKIEFFFDSIDETNNDTEGIYIDDIKIVKKCDTLECNNDEDCNDDIFCTTDVCQDGECVYATVDECCISQVDCDDGDNCTIDSCSDEGTCTHDPTTNPNCCNTDEDCNDNDECTIDKCENAVCVHQPSGAEGCCETDADCDDNDPCTIDTCESGKCVNQNTCCTSDEECDDGDDVCTIDKCVDGKCVYEPTGAEGCCDPDVFSVNFDDGGDGGFTFQNSDSAVGWNVYTGGAGAADTGALYYGNPQTMNFDSGKQNMGSAISPQIFLPAGTKITFTFDLYMDTEISKNYDRLIVYVVSGDMKYPVWDKTKLENTKQWQSVEIDLSAFAGKAISIQFFFDSVDDWSNDGEGVYIDNISITSSCSSYSCEGNEDCNDDLVFTEDTCSNGLCAFEIGGIPCTEDSDCNDGIVCTEDECNNGICVNTLIEECCENDSDCDDNNPCTTDKCEFEDSWAGYKTCSNVKIENCCTTDADCDDENPCTEDYCNADEKKCEHVLTEGCCMGSTDCVDGDTSTLDLCTQNGCVHMSKSCTEDADCNDNDDCTKDMCINGECVASAVQSETCCQNVLMLYDFEDGIGDGLEISNEYDDVGWNVSDKKPKDGTFSLWYGNPETGNYDNEKANSGTVVFQDVYLPLNVESKLVFDIYADIESISFGDELSIVVKSLKEEKEVWNKEELNTEEYKTWVTQEVDLSAFQGRVVSIKIIFDTKDASINTGEGVFIDNFKVETTCQPKTCETDEDCPIASCVQAKCVELESGKGCIYTPVENCCFSDSDCNDNDICTNDTCLDNGICENAPIEGCCKEDADCDDGNNCTVGSCSENNECTYTWVENCIVELPFKETFDGIDSFEEKGWTTVDTDGNASTHWVLDSTDEMESQHAKFYWSPKITNYVEKLISPAIKTTGHTSLTLKFEHYLDVFSLGDNETTIKVEVSPDNGETWTEVYSKSAVGDDIPLTTESLSVGSIIGDKEAVKIAFVISGESTMDLFTWEIDNVELLPGSAPEVEGISDVSVFAGETKEMEFTVTDPDDDPVTVTLADDTPEFVKLNKIDETHYKFVFTPQDSDMGTYKITFTVSDGSYELQKTFKVTVTSKDVVFEETFDTYDTLADSQWEASNENNPTKINWKIAESYTDENGKAAKFNWSPTIEDFDEWLISPSFSTKDTTSPLYIMFEHYLDLYKETSLVVSYNFSVDGKQTWTEFYKFEVNDSDADIGPAQVIKDVSDIIGNQESVYLGIHITGVNTYHLNGYYVDNIRILQGKEPPVVQDIEDVNVVIDSTKEIDVIAEDNDSDDLTFSLGEDTPAFITLEKVGPKTAKITISPAESDKGTYKVLLIVQDGIFTIQKEFTVNVTYLDEKTLLTENFDGDDTFDALGWTTDPENSNWKIDVYDGSNAAKFSYTPQVTDFVHRLISPEIDVQSSDNLLISWKHKFFSWSYDDADPPVKLAVELSFDNGNTWEEVWSHLETDGDIDTTTEQLKVKDISSKGNSFLIAFTVSGGDSYAITSWYVDNVEISGYKNPQ